MSRTKRRPIAPIVLIVAGLAGLGLAAASELTLNWNGTFQAGTIPVTADCQEDGEIAVAFSEPTLTASTANTNTPWTVAELEFSNISTACTDHAYEVAVRSGDMSWTKLANGTVNGTTLTAPIGAANPQNFDEVALTIHGTGN